MKLHYWADLRTFVDKENNIIVLWIKMMVLDAICDFSWAWSLCEFSKAGFIMEEILAHLEDDLQDFPNKESSKSKICDVCAVRSFENR
jgi:hypothetical protein